MSRTTTMPVQSDGTTNQLQPAGKKVQVQPTSEQLRIARLMDDKKDDVDLLRSNIKKVVDAMRCTEAQAQGALYDCDNDVNKAIALLLDPSNENQWVEHIGKKTKRAMAQGGDDRELSEPPSSQNKQLQTRRRNGYLDSDRQRRDPQKRPMQPRGGGGEDRRPQARRSGGDGGDSIYDRTRPQRNRQTSTDENRLQQNGKGDGAFSDGISDEERGHGTQGDRRRPGRFGGRSPFGAGERSFTRRGGPRGRGGPGRGGPRKTDDQIGMWNSNTWDNSMAKGLIDGERPDNFARGGSRGRPKGGRFGPSRRGGRQRDSNSNMWDNSMAAHLQQEKDSSFNDDGYDWKSKSTLVFTSQSLNYTNGPSELDGAADGQMGLDEQHDVQNKEAQMSFATAAGQSLLKRQQQKEIIERKTETLVVENDLKASLRQQEDSPSNTGRHSLEKLMESRASGATHPASHSTTTAQTTGNFAVSTLGLSTASDYTQRLKNDLGIGTVPKEAAISRKPQQQLDQNVEFRESVRCDGSNIADIQFGFGDSDEHATAKQIPISNNFVPDASLAPAAEPVASSAGLAAGAGDHQQLTPIAQMVSPPSISQGIQQQSQQGRDIGGAAAKFDRNLKGPEFQSGGVAVDASSLLTFGANRQPQSTLLSASNSFTHPPPGVVAHQSLGDDAEFLDTNQQNLQQNSLFNMMAKGASDQRKFMGSFQQQQQMPPFSYTGGLHNTGIPPFMANAFSPTFPSGTRLDGSNAQMFLPPQLDPTAYLSSGPAGLLNADPLFNLNMLNQALPPQLNHAQPPPSSTANLGHNQFQMGSENVSKQQQQRTSLGESGGPAPLVPPPPGFQAPNQSNMLLAQNYYQSFPFPQAFPALMIPQNPTSQPPGLNQQQQKGINLLSTGIGYDEGNNRGGAGDMKGAYGNQGSRQNGGGGATTGMPTSEQLRQQAINTSVSNAMQGRYMGASGGTPPPSTGSSAAGGPPPLSNFGMQSLAAASHAMPPPSANSAQAGFPFHHNHPNFMPAAQMTGFSPMTLHMADQRTTQAVKHGVQGQLANKGSSAFWAGN